MVRLRESWVKGSGRPDAEDKDYKELENQAMGAGAILATRNEGAEKSR